MRLAARSLLGLVLLASAGRLPAQQSLIGSGFDAVPGARAYSDTETFDAEAKRARFHLGPLLLFPQLGINGLGYTNGFGLNYTSTNGEDQTTGPRQGDFTGTARGGVRLLLPIGSRYRISGDVGLSYLWYLRSVELRRLAVDSSVAALAEVGRVRIDVSTRIFNSTIPLSSEVPVRTDQQNRGISGGVAVPLGDRLFVNARVTHGSPRYLDNGAFGGEVARLDRTDWAYSGGLAYELNRRLALGVSVQATRSRYSNDDVRDNRSTGYSFNARYGQDRAFLNAQVGYRSYDEGESKRSGVYGALAAGFRVMRAADLQVAAYRSRTDSLFLDQVAFDEQRVGAFLGYTFERFLGLRLAGGIELGDNRYSNPVTIEGTTYLRRDDVVTYRGSAGFAIGKVATVGATLSRARYTSNTPGSDRDVTEVLVNLSLFTGGIQLFK